MILVIGTGVVGRAVVEQVCEGGKPVVALARHPRLGLPAAATQYVADARSFNLGLEPRVADDLRDQVNAIVVAVGRWDLSMTMTDAYEEHLLPALGIIAFARTCRRLQSVVLVSSVLAVGTPPTGVRSDFIPATSAQHSYYEWAKREIERISQRSGLPTRIVRAGHVVDDLPNPSPNTQIAEAIRLLVRVPIAPIAPEVRYWAVPAPMVARIALAAAEVDGPKAVWAVDPGAPRYGDLFDMMATRYGLTALRVPAWRRLRNVVSLAVGGRAPLAHYGLIDFDLDLSCLEHLIASGSVCAPSSQKYIVDAFDREIARMSELR